MSRSMLARGAAGALLTLGVLEAGVALEPDLAPYTNRAGHVERLEQGELVEIEDVAFERMFGDAAMDRGSATLVLGLVDATEKTVWSVFTSFDSHAGFMPQMTRSELRPQAAEPGETAVCYEYEVLWVDSTSCYSVRRYREAGSLTGTLIPEISDDRLSGVNYFWHVRPWPDGRLLLAYFQNLSYDGPFAAVARNAFIGIGETAAAVRERVRALSRSARSAP